MSEDCDYKNTNVLLPFCFCNQTTLSWLTFREAKLLQLAWQRFTVHIVLRCTGENEAEHCHTGFDVSALCEMDYR